MIPVPFLICIEQTYSAKEEQALKRLLSQTIEAVKQAPPERRSPFVGVVNRRGECIIIGRN